VLRLWGSYGDDKPVPDPYYGGIVSPALFPRSRTERLIVLAPPCVPRRKDSSRSTSSASSFRTRFLTRWLGHQPEDECVMHWAWSRSLYKCDPPPTT
jgi:hypothetical protein